MIILFTKSYFLSSIIGFENDYGVQTPPTMEEIVTTKEQE